MYILVTGLRWRTGTDWMPYESFFTAAAEGMIDNFGGSFEIGYLIFIEIFSIILNNFTCLLLFQSFTIGYLIFRSAQYLGVSEVGFLTGLLFIQSQFWYPVRQQIAIAIIIFCWSKYEHDRKNNTSKSFMGIFLASMIHASSLIMLPLLLYFRRRLSLVMWMSLAILVIGYQYGALILQDFLQSRIDTYVLENNYDFNPIRKYFRILERSFSLCLVLYFLKSKFCKLSSEKNNILFTLIVIGVLVSVIYLVFFPYLTRLALFFNWAEAVVFAATISTFRSFDSYRLSLFGCWLFFLNLKFFGSLLSYWDLLNPYYFFFENYQRTVY